MGILYNNYIDTITNESTKKTLKSSYKAIGDYEDSAKTIEDVKKIFYASKVDTPQSARSLCSQFRQFAIYLNDQSLINMLDSIDCLDVCLKVKELGVAKYFSNKQFQAALKRIDNGSVMNPFYVQTLFLCIYEGVYSRDFSVLVNLRLSDIHDNYIVCRKNDGTKYEIEVSDDLISRLTQLGNTHSWVCRNKNGYFDRNIFGEYSDSCFKVEKRDRKSRVSLPSETYVNTYRNRLREIISTELGYNISAFEIYISGIMHRISLNLKANNINVYDAFSKNNRDSSIKKIFENELKRCHYESSVSQFKQRVEGHLDLFDLSDTKTVILIQPGEKRIIDENIEDLITYKDLYSENISDTISLGIVQPKLETKMIENRCVYPRNRAMAHTALVLARYRCEIDNEHPTFISKSGNAPYMEPHHLIPLAFADNFDVSLDVAENIVSLCSNCHNEIHYGKDITNILKWLYENRKTKLQQVGIKISFEELLSMYSNTKK